MWLTIPNICVYTLFYCLIDENQDKLYHYRNRESKLGHPKAPRDSSSSLFA